MPRGYSPKLKFQVIRELLTTDKSRAQIGRAYGIHPNTIKKWEEIFNEKGPEIFQREGEVSGYEKKISELEQLLGKKEVEIALLKNFLGQEK